MNDQDYSYNLSTDETDHNRSLDIESKTCPFSGQASHKGLEIPKGHEQYTESDKEKCPVMSGLVKAPIQNGAKTDIVPAGTIKKKEKKPKGGCPFMASDNKKTPALQSYTPSYEQTYSSAISYMINYKVNSNKNSLVSEEKRWNNLPVFLKHTLFHEEDQLDRIRKMELGQRFFVYEKFREQANKGFNKGRYEEALGLYELALSCVKWLRYKDIPKNKAKKSESASETDISTTKDDKSQTEEEKEKEIKTNKSEVDEKSSNGTFENFEEDGEEEEKEEDQDPYKDLKSINKAMLKPLKDENIEICDGEDMEDDGDRDMRNSMLLSVYHGLAVCYFKLHHYSVALQAIEEGIKINPASSQLHYRRSQARTLNKGSMLEELLLAKEDIEKAIELKKTERVFKNEPGILKVMNIHNADEAYREQAAFTEAAINERRKELRENIRAIMSKVREIEFIEDAFRKEGKKVPFGDPQQSMHALDMNNADDDQMEFEVTNEIIKKYNKLIEFYQGTDRKDQVDLAKKEIQNVLEVCAKMKEYRALDFSRWEQNELIKESLEEIKVDMSSKKVQERLRRFKNQRSKELFEDGNFNLEVYQYALRDHLKKKQEEELKAKKGRSGHDEIEPKKNRFKVFGVELGFNVVMFFVMLLAFWCLHKNNLLPSALLWSDRTKGPLV